jgi:bifunctional ADP-heptose synthase (sugar kinase/adenylyltransferase)
MKKSVLLIGDTIIDKYVFLRPMGFSLETPTIKCQKISERKEYGGAANVARKLVELGCDVDFITSISSKEKSCLELTHGLRVIRIDVIDQIKERYYLTKNETYKYLQVNDCKEITLARTSIEIDVKKYDAFAVSDYRLGVVSNEILRQLPKSRTICQMQTSDSHSKIDKYHDFHCFIGNEDETPKSNLKQIRTENNFDVCISTGGSKEIVAVTANKRFVHKPAKLKNVRDYHGAGDAFFAGFCSLYDGKNIQDSIEFGDKIARDYLIRRENVE